MDKDLKERLAALENQGYSVTDDSDQPGLWVWMAPTDNCDISFHSQEEAIEDAWRDATQQVLSILPIAKQDWDDLSLQQKIQQMDNALSGEDPEILFPRSEKPAKSSSRSPR